MFSSRTENKKLIDGLGIPDFKNIRQEPKTQVARKKCGKD
jgi:hypothetical protein